MRWTSGSQRLHHSWFGGIYGGLHRIFFFREEEDATEYAKEKKKVQENLLGYLDGWEEHFQWILEGGTMRYMDSLLYPQEQGICEVKELNILTLFWDKEFVETWIPQPFLGKCKIMAYMGPHIEVEEWRPPVNDELEEEKDVGAPIEAPIGAPIGAPIEALAEKGVEQEEGVEQVPQCERLYE